MSSNLQQTCKQKAVAGTTVTTALWEPETSSLGLDGHQSSLHTVGEPVSKEY